MPEFEIRVTQQLHGYYEGYLKVQAKTRKEAIKNAEKMNLEDIDEQVSWSHMDEYEGDYKTIEIQEE